MYIWLVVSTMCTHCNSKAQVYIIMFSILPFRRSHIHLSSTRCYQGFRSPGGPVVQFRTFSPGFRKTLLPCGSLRARPFSIWWNASPGWAGWGNSMACFIDGFARSRCFLSMTSVGMDVRMLSSCGTSSSATKTPISSHGMASAKGRTMSSAMITGMQPKTTASTSLGLHGAQPNGHRQNTERCMSS